MHQLVKLFTLSSVILLSACAGQQRPAFSEVMRDQFAFTAAKDVPDSERRCIAITKTFQMPVGPATYTFPAGQYVAKKMNNTGYFYYAPHPVASSSWFFSDPLQGIYVNKGFTSANIFAANSMGYSDRPIRGAVLPAADFALVKKSHC